MPMRKLVKPEWQSYFDHVSKSLGPKQVEIEISSLAIGNQVEVSQVELKGLTYDPKSDILEVMTDSLGHAIRNPTEIYIQESGDGLAAIEVLDGDANKQIIKLTAPLLITGGVAQ